MIQSNTLKQICEVLAQARRCLVVSHYNPDADAYGSSCALTLGLRTLGKEAICVNEDGINKAFSFIPGVSEVVSDFPSGPWDLIIACDCGDQKRIGDSLSKKMPAGVPLVNIDHHQSNNNFGTYNLVLERASSTAEIIYEVLSGLKVQFNESIATSLMAGIMADTGSFRYSSTSTETFRVAADLMSRGALPHEIAKQLYSRRSLASVKLEAETFRNLSMHFGGKVSEVIVDSELVKALGASRDDSEGFAERARDIEGVLVSIFIRREDDLWKISLRSKNEKYDVSAVAADFGGGGHRQAAAFRWRGTLEELRKKLTERVGRAIGA